MYKVVGLGAVSQYFCLPLILEVKIPFHVIFQIQELCKEESQWTSYSDDELTVKMRMTEAIFDSLILDTIRVLNKIYLKKACFKGDSAPSFFF